MNNILAKITEFGKKYGHELFVIVSMALIAYISYELGRIQALEKTPLKVLHNAQILDAVGSDRGSNMAEPRAPQAPRDPRVVASKTSSTKKYHYSWCSGAQRIKLENQVWFPTAADAEKVGYTLAGNCQ